MATNTYVSLATYTAPSATNTYTFNTISGSYTDLVLVIVGKNNSGTGNDNFALRFNNDSNSNYSDTAMKANGSSASTDRRTNQTLGYVGQMYPNFSTTIVNIQNYSNTSVYKMAISKFGDISSSSVIGTRTVLWRSTSAITSITVVTGGDSWAAGTTMTIYGIANSNTGALATGGVITYDSTYYYHTFGSNGTFTPKQNLSNVDYLVVAGAGGGGNNGGGGGGAGGLRSTVDVTGGGGSLESKLSLNNGTAYTITVGAGGNGGATTNQDGSNGGDSSISGSGLTTITSIGGGGGGSGAGTVGKNGGSGGGSFNAGGSPTTNQGYAGGYMAVAYYSGGNYGAGAGGGAGGVGGNTRAYVGGGIGGSAVAIPNMANVTGTGVLTYYAGGGGGGGYDNSGVGGSGGNGGAGTGGTSGGSSATRATSNTGSGGGGGNWVNNGSGVGGNGGSGIVIIRYAK